MKVLVFLGGSLDCKETLDEYVDAYYRQYCERYHYDTAFKREFPHRHFLCGGSLYSLLQCAERVGRQQVGTAG